MPRSPSRLDVTGVLLLSALRLVAGEWVVARAGPQAIVVVFDPSQEFYYRDIIGRLKELDWSPAATLVR